MSKIEEMMALHLSATGFKPKREHRFHPTRRWRFDFALIPERIAIECEGGVYTHGRHVRGKGFEGDCEKYNQATILGWRVLRFTPKMIKSGQAILDVEAAIRNGKKK